jgi:hypothetical protein
LVNPDCAEVELTLTGFTVRWNTIERLLGDLDTETDRSKVCEYKAHSEKKEATDVESVTKLGIL